MRQADHVSERLSIVLGCGGDVGLRGATKYGSERRSVIPFVEEFRRVLYFSLDKHPDQTDNLHSGRDRSGSRSRIL